MYQIRMNIILKYFNEKKKLSGICKQMQMFFVVVAVTRLIDRVYIIGEVAFIPPIIN